MPATRPRRIRAVRVTHPVASAAVILLVMSAVLVAQDARLTTEQQRQFLRTADIVSSRPIGKGVTGSLRLTLTDGKLTHDAAFQSIDDRPSSEDRRRMRKRAGELNFVDSYKYNIAAYEIARLLGLDEMMPTTVARFYRGRRGSLTWWVDDVLMDEAEREKTQTSPPSPIGFQRERMKMLVFAELVGDTDRNKGNVLYTTDWRVIMIDFTRAFRLHVGLRRAETLTTINRNLWERLQKLTRREVSEVADIHLVPEEIGALMRRQEALVEHYRRLIKQRGQDSVLY